MSRKTTGTPVAARRRVAVGTVLLSATALVGGGLALATPGETPTVSTVHAYGTTDAAAGPLSGGSSSVTVKGTHFDQSVKVFFGSVQATRVVKESATELTVTPPAGSAGKVDVTVVTGSSAGSATSATGDDYTYTAGPVVSSVATSSSTPKKLVVTGSQLSGATAVLVGDTLVKVVKTSPATATEVSVPLPALKGGSYDVSVVNPLGIGTKTGAWGSAPAITKIWVPGVDRNGKAVEVVASRGADNVTATATATTGATSTVVVNVSGTGFTGLTSVRFGAAEATFSVVSDTLARVGVPPTAVSDAAGFTGTSVNSLKVDVSATNPHGTVTKAKAWTYDRLPTLSSFGAKTAGGVTIVEKKTTDTGTTTITLKGTNLNKVTAVKFAKSATDTVGTTVTKVSESADGTEWVGTFKVAKTGTTAGLTQVWVATASGLANLPDVLTWKTS